VDKKARRQGRITKQSAYQAALPTLACRYYHPRWRARRALDGIPAARPFSTVARVSVGDVDQFSSFMRSSQPVEPKCDIIRSRLSTGLDTVLQD